MPGLSNRANADIKAWISNLPHNSFLPSSPEPSSPQPPDLETNQAHSELSGNQLQPPQFMFNEVISIPLSPTTMNMNTDHSSPLPSPVDVEEAASVIDMTMQLAREKVLARLERLQSTSVESPSLLTTVPTKEQLELEERIDSCNVTAQALLAEARAYLHDNSAQSKARATTARQRLSSGMLLARLTKFEAKADADMSARRSMQLLAEQEKRAYEAADPGSSSELEE